LVDGRNEPTRAFTTAVQLNCSANVGEYTISLQMELLAVLAPPVSHAVSFASI